MIEDTPIVFVVPPNNSLQCPLHEGVLEDPVDTPCGCTFCRSCILETLNTTHECPVHGSPLVPEHLRENPQVQGHINALLIHCKGGLQRTVSGEWVPNAQGCSLWLTLGNRAEHESVCVHVNNGKEIERHTPVRTCAYREHGCLFVGKTEQDILVHDGVCGYARLLAQIEELKAQLSQKDLEIEGLNNLLLLKEQKSAFSISLPDVPNVNEVIDSISRGLDKLDQDSTKLFEDAKDTLKKTKTKAYRSSLKVLHSIKEVVEFAKTEFIAKLEELELIAKDKVRLITSSSTQPATTTTTQPSETSNVETTAVEQTSSEPIDQVIVENNINNNNNEQAPTESTSNSVSTMGNEEVSEGDDDLKEFLEASKQEYLQFEAARMAEEEAIRHAMRLSLLDLASKEK